MSIIYVNSSRKTSVKVPQSPLTFFSFIHSFYFFFPSQSVVIITEGKFANSAEAVASASKLKNQSIDVFAVAVGPDPDVPTLKGIVSPKVENNVFMTTTYDALRPHRRALTDTVCEGGKERKEQCDV